MPLQPIRGENGSNGPNWQCCLADSSKMAPIILITMVQGDYSCEVISLVHWVPQFFMRNKSILGGVSYVRPFIFVKYFSVLLDAENFQSCSCHFFFLFENQWIWVNDPLSDYFFHRLVPLSDFSNIWVDF